MENQNPTRTQSLNLDIISSLPQNIIEIILSLMPIRDALRTSVLSKRWQYCWRSMPKLVFTNNMVTGSCNHLCKYKLVNAIFHVLLLHNGPETLVFDCSVVHLHMESDFAQIISYLARGNKVKKLSIFSDGRSYKLPVSFFSLQGLELVYLDNCTLELPLTFKRFSSLTSMTLWNVEVSAQMLHRFISKCPLLQELVIFSDAKSYKLPVFFFSLQGLELLYLNNCTLKPPLTFNGFSSLTSMTLWNVEVSAQMLQRFISKCPLLQYLCLNELRKGIDSVARGNKFTFVDLLPCIPLIQTLDISKYYTKYLCAGGMPHMLPASLVHLKDLFLYVCLLEQNEISSALCIIRSSPMLEGIIFQMYDNDKLPVRQTPANFLDVEGYPDLKLDNLETLVIEMFSNLPLEMEFVKLIMAKSPVLKKVRIELNDNVSLDEELEMLRELVSHPIPRASPSAMLTVVRPKTS